MKKQINKTLKRAKHELEILQREVLHSKHLLQCTQNQIVQNDIAINANQEKLSTCDNDNYRLVYQTLLENAKERKPQLLTVYTRLKKEIDEMEQEIERIHGIITREEH